MISELGRIDIGTWAWRMGGFLIMFNTQLERIGLAVLLVTRYVTRSTGFLCSRDGDDFDGFLALLLGGKTLSGIRNAII